MFSFGLLALLLSHFSHHAIYARAIAALCAHVEHRQPLLEFTGLRIS
jgi:hypothetical protein